ncbi:MAG TPA: hypothetical protein VIH10_03890 [Kribbella sp.]
MQEPIAKSQTAAAARLRARIRRAKKRVASSSTSGRSEFVVTPATTVGNSTVKCN